MKEIEFEIPGVMGKMRARTVRRGGFTKSYTPEQDVNYENLVKTLYLNKANGLMWNDKEPIEMHIVAYFDIPKSYSKKKSKAAAEHQMFPCKRPDLDNIAKIILDGLNKVAYHDDAQVVLVTVLKVFHNDLPKVKVTIRDMGFPFGN